MVIKLFYFVYKFVFMLLSVNGKGKLVKARGGRGGGGGGGVKIGFSSFTYLIRAAGDEQVEKKSQFGFIKNLR